MTTQFGIRLLYHGTFFGLPLCCKRRHHLSFPLNSNCSRLGDVYQSNDNCFMMFFVSTGRFCVPTIRMPNSGRSRRTKKTPEPNTHVQERNTLKMEELKKKNSFKTLVAGNLCQRLRSQSRCQSVVIISASCLFLNKLFRQECLLV